MALKWLGEHVAESPPREINTLGETRPVLFFTDGAAEDSKERKHQYTTCGALIFDTASGEQFYFGCEIDPQVVASWSRGGKSQVIGQAELYPIVVSRLLMNERLRQRRCFFFIDNDSARDSMIAAYSPVAASMFLIYRFLVQDFVSPIHAWFSRVQSVSNAGDDPSRLKFSQVAKDWPKAKWLDPAATCRELDQAILAMKPEDMLSNAPWKPTVG
jgi:hypothetical protein